MTLLTLLLQGLLAMGWNAHDFKKPTDEELKKQLNALQYKVTQKEGTEPPFQNEYWDNKREGIYVDIVSGEPLFSSLDKFDSGTGWPSFTKPIDKSTLTEKVDGKLWMKRTEVRSKLANSHLGHVFDDGPKESTGLRYCMNSASMKFIAKENLEKEGYGNYLELFVKKPIAPAKNNYKKALFAGGCFWCVEHAFEEHKGVITAISGYTGGKIAKPTYDQVSTGKSGHLEALEVTYDPALISYEKLLEIFWTQIDPTDPEGQFIDRGQQYTTGIFYIGEEQKKLAEKSLRDLEKSKKFTKKIVTLITPFKEFYPAEEHHQDYYKKNPERYKTYSSGTGRKEFIEKQWGIKK